MRDHVRLRAGVVAGLVAVAGLGGAASASASVSERGGYVPILSGTVTPSVNGLRIRSGPGTGAVAEGLLYRGDHMVVTSEERRPRFGTWFSVDLTRRSAGGLRRGFRGWVYAPYIRHLK